MKKYFSLLLVFLTCHLEPQAQSYKREYQFIKSGSIVQDKNYYLFTLLQKVPEFRNAISADEGCKAMSRGKMQAISAALEEIRDSVNFLTVYQFSEEEMEHARSVAGKLWSVNKSFRSISTIHLRPSGSFALYDASNDSMMLMLSLSEAMLAVNHIIDTYGLGRKGANAATDSVSHDVRSAYYKSVLVSNARISSTALDTVKLFFEAPLNMALSLLYLNNRNEVARFEPLANGENRMALKNISAIQWSNYRYSAILVPGFGPEDGSSLDPVAKLRLILAVERFRKKLAPFIIVSGGYVHPFQTPYCEAIEMKLELIRNYGIPESAIIVEPHARHTTTNIRNANRLILRYGLPAAKPVLLTTTVEQSFYIQAPGFKKRCQADMGHIPFKSLTRISVYDLEYLPVLVSLHMKPSDPLDP